MPMNSFGQAVIYVGLASTPPALVGVGTNVITAQDMLSQAPILGILVLVVFLFLKHIKETAAARALADKEISDQRNEVMSHMGDDCHAVQREANEIMKKMQGHMEADAEVRGKTLAIIERMSVEMDDRDRERSRRGA